MINSFDTEVAIDVGINAAIIYRNIQYWCEKNRTNGQNEFDGYFWTFNSVIAFEKQFPYLSGKQIRNALKVLEEKGYIKSGNFNKSAYDRTKWYADIRSDLEGSICQKEEIHLPFCTNGNGKKGEPIPNINTNINTDSIFISMEPEEEKGKRFHKPSLEEIEAYCEERGNDVDAKKFFEYYEAGNWRDAKGKPVKNWKQKIITWEKNSNGKPIGSYSKPNNSGNEFLDLLKEMKEDDDE